MRRSAILLALLFLSLSRLPAAAAERSAADSSYLFAINLYEQADYYRAVTEFKRYAFEAGTPSADLKAQYAIAACYQNAREWPRAIDAWRLLIGKYPTDPVTGEAAYRLAECMLAGGQFDSALAVAQTYLRNAPADSDYRDDAHLLGAIALLSKRKWGEAEALLAEFHTAFPSSDLLPAADSLAEAATKLKTMPRKSPEKAGLLSMILPGLGQGYAGRGRDGWTAFFVNAVFAGFVADRFRHHDRTAAYTLLAVSGTFYAGNVYGAGRAATTVNQQREDDMIRNAVQKIMGSVSTTLGHPSRLKPPAL